MKSNWFYPIFLSFLFGVACASFFDIWLLFSVLPLFFLAFLFKKIRDVRKIFFISVLALIAGFWRMDISKSDIHPLDSEVGNKVSLQGFICNEPEDREFNQRFCFKPEIVSSDRIIIRTSRFPRYKYGDYISVVGKLELPENFESYEGGPEFDYVSYLDKDSIRYVISRPEIKIIGENRGNKIKQFLIFTKNSFMDRVRSVLPEPHSSLIAGLLLGEKSGLSEDISENFKKSGLTHILVLSGSNVTVVAESLMKIFSFLPRTMGQITGAVSVIMFAVMTGASTTTVRATIMAMILLSAGRFGRKYDVVRALILAGFIMVIHNPKVLVFDISFQLSFLATMAIIYVSPIVKEFCRFVPERFAFRDVFAMTLSTQIFTMPFIVYKMGEISIIALVPNMLILPTVPLIMLLGFVTGLFGFMGFWLAFPLAVVSRTLLNYMIYLVEFFGGFPLATIKITTNFFAVVVIYVLYIFIILFFQKRQKLQEKNSSQQIAN